MARLQQTLKDQSTLDSEMVGVHSPPMSEKLIRVERLKVLMRQRGWSKSELARQLGVQPSYVSSLLGAGPFAEKAARTIEEKLHLGRFWLDERADGSSPKSKRGSANFDQTSAGTTARSLPVPAPEPQPEYAGKLPPPRRVPVVGTAKLGENGWYEEISAHVGGGDGHVEIYTRDPNAYALKVRGDSMHPAIRDGWLVVIEPNASVAAGEYVLVGLRDGRKMVKELLYTRADSVALISVNGDVRMSIPQEEIEFIYPVSNVVAPSKWKP
jgi:phage repressor protein C with HTH and peptisase S24 domain